MGNLENLIKAVEFLEENTSFDTTNYHGVSVSTFIKEVEEAYKSVDFSNLDEKEVVDEFDFLVE